MIIVCKHNFKPGSGWTPSNQYLNLTIGKKYTTLSDFNDSDIMVEMIDDVGDKSWYPKKNFYSLDSYRDYKLNKLGI